MNFKGIKDYLKKSVIEIKKVRWLSREETIKFTLEVIVFSLIFVIIYGIFDSLFIKILFLMK